MNFMEIYLWRQKITGPNNFVQARKLAKLKCEDSMNYECAFFL